MERREFIVIFGLLILEVLAALYFSLFVKHYLIELVVAAWFVLVTGIFLNLSAQHKKHAAAVATFAFLVAIVHVVVVSFFMVSLWLIIVLCLSLAGMMLSWMVFEKKPTYVITGLVGQKKVLDKELPPRPPTKVIVYHEEGINAKKKKSSKKKTVKKKTAPKKTKKKVAGNKKARGKKKSATSKKK